MAICAYSLVASSLLFANDQDVDRKYLLEYGAKQSAMYVIHGGDITHKNSGPYPDADWNDTVNFFSCAFYAMNDHYSYTNDSNLIRDKLFNIWKYVRNVDNPHDNLSTKEIDNVINFAFRPCRRLLPDQIPQFWK